MATVGQDGAGRSGDGGAAPPAGAPQGRRGWPYWNVVAVLVVGLITTGVLTWVSDDLHLSNEKHLLSLRTKDVGTVLTSALPSIQTPLASAAALADATHGDRAKFKQFVASYVGRGPGRPFVSVSLWRVGDPGARPVAVVGAAPTLAPSTSQAATFFAGAARMATLSVIGLLGRHRLGYAFTGAAHGPFAAYGESVLPANRYTPPQRNAAFNDINFALYLGRSPKPGALLIASVHRLPLSGRHDLVRIPFGNTFFTVTTAARGPLAGSLPQDLPWLIAIVGTLLTLGGAGLTGRLIQRRRSVERLAEENRELYAAQRTIAQTLQHALLPAQLPQPPGLQVSVRYDAGVEGVDVGGDWYDLIALEDGRLLLVVGDVSGRGLRAATTMASLRFALHAYVAEGHDPATCLRRLSGLVSVSADRQLATVLCALIDIDGRRVDITNAGHLPLLMLSSDGAKFLESEVGVPVGVDPEPSYSATTVSVPPGATLLAFTDGLVERRGETIDAGLERLRSSVRVDHLGLDQLVTQVLDMREDAVDDTAIAAIRWTT